MSVARIALGVFLGNLAFGLLAWLVVAFFIHDTHMAAAGEQTERQYNELQAEVRSNPQPPR